MNKVKYKITVTDESGSVRNCFATTKKELNYMIKKTPGVSNIEDLTNYYNKLGYILERV